MWSALTLEQKSRMEDIRCAQHRLSSSHSFPSLYLWQEDFGVSVWLETEGFLLRKKKEGGEHYFFPCGTDSVKREMLTALPDGSVLHYADDADVAWLQQIPGLSFAVSSARDDWEYLCDRSAQLALRGSAYADLRYHVHHVRKNPNWRVEPITADNLECAYEVERRWNQMHREEAPQGDLHAAQRALHNFSELGLRGVIAYWKGEPIGYGNGFCSDSSMFVGSVLRCLRREGYAALRYELFQSLPDTVKLINLEEDLGLPGLRTNKTQMNPVGFLRMYTVSLRRG